eukprot:5853608-Prymnesium_polylepis.4
MDVVCCEKPPSWKSTSRKLISSFCLSSSSAVMTTTFGEVASSSAPGMPGIIIGFASDATKPARSTATRDDAWLHRDILHVSHGGQNTRPLT